MQYRLLKYLLFDDKVPRVNEQGTVLSVLIGFTVKVMWLISAYTPDITVL